MNSIKLNEKILKEYNIDILNEYASNDVSEILFCFDWTKRGHAEVFFLRGNPSLVGIKDIDTFRMADFLKIIEIRNPFSEVFGRDNYVNNIKRDLTNLDRINELYLPVRNEEEVLWLCLSIQSLTKKNSENELIYGRVNWVSKKTPKAILYYHNRYKDAQTDLFTRESLKLHLSLTRETDHSYGLFFDIDNFKRINDLFGHRAGDHYLKQLADKFIKNFEKDVMYYRVGGDEFFVYLVNSTEEEAYKKALDIIYIVETLNPQGQQVEVSASVGIIPIIGNNLDFNSLFELADKAMYFSKRKGKGNISYAREV